jgi:hypothetical protein
VKRVMVIVDGLNLMHSLVQQNPRVEYVNLVDLANRLINVRTETLVGIQYFSALASHISDGQIRLTPELIEPHLIE